MKVIKSSALAVALIGSYAIQSGYIGQIRDDVSRPGITERPEKLNRPSSAGMLDSAFGVNGVVTTSLGPGNDVAQAVAVQPDGKILVAGYAFNGANNDFAVIRYNGNGVLDDNFDGDSDANGIILTPMGTSEDEAFGIALQNDGKILVVGQTINGVKTDIAIARYNSDGTLDTTFDGDGRRSVSPSVGNALARSVAVQADGKIVVTGIGLNGANFDIVVVRLMADGSLDTSFDGDSGIGDGIVTTQVGAGNDQAYTVAVRPDGKIVVAGYYSGAVSTDTVLLRYESDGRLDPSFGVGGISAHSFSPADTDEALSMVLQPDGKIVIAGCIRTPGIANDFLVARFEEDGSRDDSFANNGFLVVAFSSATDIALGVALQNDGKIVATGFGNNGSNNDFAVTRVNSNGTLDNSFGIDGKALTAVGTSTDVANAVAVQPDGKIVVVGRTVGVTADFGVVRYAAGNATVSGRVLTPAGLALRNTRVNLIDVLGASRFTTTSSFGTYQFDNIAVGQEYTITVNSKRYRFSPRIVTINDNLSNLDFVGLE